jgi:aminoglycoside phosphotransferase family enzyme/predicted kinase
MTDTSLPPLIQQMLMSSFYPHPVAGEVKLVQTHISYVLLTGDFAYKLKKPLNFGFLDFSTLEKRQHFCQEELRLNQRGAAELYLEVLPIVQVGDRFQLGGEGEPVEYVLKMRQFPQDRLLVDLFDRGEVTADLVRQLALAIAAFHTQLETSDYIRSFGAVERVREAFDENYSQTELYIGGPQTQEQFEQTRQATDRIFAERRELLNSRIRQHWIRECHGDLHLGNICYWNDTFLLFDCIEFNEPFRFVDVIYDIAYIVMDFQMRQRPDLSAVFLNTYIEQTGDWEGLQLLPLYVSRQSYVRAKVMSFLLGDPSVPSEVKQTASDTAAKYYHLAWQCLQPRQGKLFVMSGLSGSGKSTVAGQLAQQLDAIHIRSDAVRKHLAGIPLDRRGDVAGSYGSGIYTPEMTAKTYDRLLELGILLAEQGFPVVLDAKYDRKDLRQVLQKQAERHRIPFTFVACTAPIETVRQWLQNRTEDIADATADMLTTQQQTFEPLTDEELAQAVTIHTDRDLAPQLQSLC